MGKTGVNQDLAVAKLQTGAPLRVALIAQWGDRLRPPGGGSVALCTRYLARALADRGCLVRVYGVEWEDDRDSAFEYAGAGFRLLRPALADRLLFRAFRKTRRLHPLPNGGRAVPAWSARAAGPSWRGRIAADLARDPVDLVLCQHGARPVPSAGPTTLRDHFDHIKGWVSGIYFASEPGLKELGYTGNVFHEKYVGCEHEGKHA